MVSSLSFIATATTEIYTLSLHDALPISKSLAVERSGDGQHLAHSRASTRPFIADHDYVSGLEDRKSTRLNSSHLGISYAVFCLKKKNIIMLVAECLNCSKAGTKPCTLAF